MSDFSKCVVHTLSYEGIDSSPTGSYSNHPLDKGGPTKYGISLKFAKGTKDFELFDATKDKRIDSDDIRVLSFDDAVQAYKKYFWDYFDLDTIEDNKKCFVVFDAAVNHGIGGATKLMQKTLVDLGYNVTIDGLYGPKTKAAFVNAQPEDFVINFLDKRESLFRAIVKNNPSQKVFLKGWLNRIENIKRDMKYV